MREVMAAVCARLAKLVLGGAKSAATVGGVLVVTTACRGSQPATAAPIGVQSGPPEVGVGSEVIQGFHYARPTFAEHTSRTTRLGVEEDGIFVVCATGDTLVVRLESAGSYGLISVRKRRPLLRFRSANLPKCSLQGFIVVSADGKRETLIDALDGHHIPVNLVASAKQSRIILSERGAPWVFAETESGEVYAGDWDMASGRMRQTTQVDVLPQWQGEWYGMATAEADESIGCSAYLLKEGGSPTCLRDAKQRRRARLATCSKNIRLSFGRGTIKPVWVSGQGCYGLWSIAQPTAIKYILLSSRDHIAWVSESLVANASSTTSVAALAPTGSTNRVSLWVDFEEPVVLRSFGAEILGMKGSEWIAVRATSTEDVWWLNLKLRVATRLASTVDCPVSVEAGYANGRTLLCCPTMPQQESPNRDPNIWCKLFDLKEKTTWERNDLLEATILQDGTVVGVASAPSGEALVRIDVD